MYSKTLLALLFWVALGTALRGQEPEHATMTQRQLRPLVVSVFNQATLLPGTVFFSDPVHLGVSVGTEFRYNQSTRNEWFQTAKIAVVHHQYVQTAVQLYSEGGYRRTVWNGIGVELRLGAGYLHAISAEEIFHLKNGVYEPAKGWGRPQFMGSAAFGLSYRWLKGRRAPRLFVEEQFFLQMPFVKSYVPLMPNTALHLGAAIPLW